MCAHVRLQGMCRAGSESGRLDEKRAHDSIVSSLLSPQIDGLFADLVDSLGLEACALEFYNQIFQLKETILNKPPLTDHYGPCECLESTGSLESQCRKLGTA